MTKFALIVSPTSGGGKAKKLLPQIEAELRAAGRGFSAQFTTGIRHATALAAAAIELGDIPVAVGGDGLVRAVAQAAVGTDGTIGVLPGGRGNDFAAMLGIPFGIVEATKMLTSASARRVDVGAADGTIFVGIASYGYDSDANRIANEIRWVRGTAVYAVAALRALRTWKSANMTVEIDGATKDFYGYTVAVANSRQYGGGMRIAPNASISDGLFDVIAVEHVSKLRFLLSLGKVFKGEHVKQETVHEWRGKRLIVDADRPFDVYADGDPIGRTPLELEIKPGALSVIAP